MTEDTTISTREAAEHLGVDARSVLNMVRRGELPATYTWRGRQRVWSFERSDVERVAASRKSVVVYQPDED